MADQATQRTTIMAPASQCFNAITDFENYPRWARDVRQALVISRDHHGRAVDVEFHVTAMGRSTDCMLRYFYGEDPLRLAWRLRHGDTISRLDGEYEFLPVVGDDYSTDVTYHLSVELSVPLTGFVRRRAESRIMRIALSEFKAYVEAGGGAGS